MESIIEFGYVSTGRLLFRICARAIAILSFLLVVGLRATSAQHQKPGPSESYASRPGNDGADTPSLLQRARRYIGTPGVVKPVQKRVIPYEWLSNRFVIYWQWLGNDSVKAVRVDTETGERDALKAFNARLAVDFIMGNALVSPDGGWVLCREASFGSPPLNWRAVSLDGKQALNSRNFTDTIEPPLRGIWTPDGKAWVSLEGPLSHATAYRCTRDDPSHVTSRKCIGLPISSRDSRDRIRPLLGFSVDGRAVVTRWHPFFYSAKGPISIFEFDIALGESSPRVHTFRLPEGARADELVLARQGDRLAWKFYFDRHATEAGRSKVNSTVEIWVSNLDGSAMRCIGIQPVKQATKSIYQDDFPFGIRWTPNGKRISYLYQDALYSIAAN